MMQLFNLFHFSLQTKKILKTWIPLAASWLLMGIEMPAITAVMARLPHPEISLAAHGGTACPISRPASASMRSPAIRDLAARSSTSGTASARPIATTRAAFRPPRR
ncbi:MAG: hypothetical protein HGB14_01575, partial [Anaerolineaceae bacterium]|nr:hypothetical protein [Anaerolineaceae bacterium]